MPDTLITLAKSSVTVGKLTMVRTGANQSTTSTSLADVPGMAFNLAANSKYLFEFTGMYTAAAGTTGLSLSVNGPAAPTFMRFCGQICTSVTATANGGAGAYDVQMTASNSGGATALPFWLKGSIDTGATAGVFSLRFASEVGGSAVTILRGSLGELAAAEIT